MSKQRTLITKITSRDPRGLQATSLFEAAYNNAELDEARAQLLNEHGGEFQKHITEVITDLTAVPYYYAYPKEYKEPKPIGEQIETLADIFKLDPAGALEYVKNLPQLPDGAEGWFAIPRWEEIAEKYSEALSMTIKAMIKRHKIWYGGYWRELKNNYYLQEKTAKALQELANKQEKHDILVVPCQFGVRYKSVPVCRVRELIKDTNEFGLNSLTVGAMLLIHPKRLVRRIDLQIDCAGDGFFFNVYCYGNCVGSFEHAPCFYCSEDKKKDVIHFSDNDLDGHGPGRDYRNYGSATGFLF